MSDKNLYQKAIQYRIWDNIKAFFAKLPQSKANAVYVAVGFFVILIAFMEYKVFESTYFITGNIVLSVSVMGVTAFGGIVAETILKRNSKANDDQIQAADALFYISLFASAVAGFGVWAQSQGVTNVTFFKLSVALPEFGQFVFVMITLVTIIDIFILRWYISEDVDAKHQRNVERVNSRKRAAELATDESLIEFEAEVERKARKTLKIEKRKQELKQELTRMYGGDVPANVLADAMKKLDEIKTSDDLADDDGDGVANKDDNTYNAPLKLANTYASEAEKPNFTNRQSQK